MNGFLDDDDSITFKNGQLSLIGQNLTNLKPALSHTECKNVKRLDLSFNCLRSVDGLKNFSNLQELILDNNDLEEFSFPELPFLHTLMLNKNKIRELDKLLDEIENKLSNLTYLSLLGNVACPDQLSSTEYDDDDYRRYRLYVVYRLPMLKFLDSSAVKEQERTEAKKQGSFLKVVRPNSSLSNSTDTTTSNGLPYSPLPNTTREDPDHKAMYGKCRYVYYGRHSEGNRFIRNNDL